MDPLGLTSAAWEALAVSWGQPRYRGRQIFDALHRSGRLDYASMQELPGDLRERLARELPIRLPEVARREDSADGSVKLGLRLEDGALIEAVYMPTGEASAEVNEFSDARAVSPAPDSQTRASKLDASRDPLHRLPFFPDGLRRRLRLLRDGAPGRRAQSLGGRDPGAAPRAALRGRPRDRGDAPGLHGHGRAVSESRGGDPGARGPLRARFAAPRHRVDLRHHARLRALRRAAEAAEPRGVPERGGRGGAREADADHEDLPARGPRRGDAGLAARGAPVDPHRVRAHRRRQRLAGGGAQAGSPAARPARQGQRHSVERGPGLPAGLEDGPTKRRSTLSSGRSPTRA